MNICFMEGDWSTVSIRGGEGDGVSCNVVAKSQLGIAGEGCRGLVYLLLYHWRRDVWVALWVLLVLLRAELRQLLLVSVVDSLLTIPSILLSL